MRESRTYGSVRGALRKGRPYRDTSLRMRLFLMPLKMFLILSEVEGRIAVHAFSPAGYI